MAFRFVKSPRELLNDDLKSHLNQSLVILDELVNDENLSAPERVDQTNLLVHRLAKILSESKSVKMAAFMTLQLVPQLSE